MCVCVFAELGVECSGVISHEVGLFILVVIS